MNETSVMFPGNTNNLYQGVLDKNDLKIISRYMIRESDMEKI